jgi:hypothetical protein
MRCSLFLLTLPIVTTWGITLYYGKRFTVTQERQSGVSMYIPQAPSTGNHATYQKDLKKLAWYYAVWQ